MGSFLFSPTLGTPVGMLQLKYTVRMVNYPDRTVTENFVIQVDACVVTQILSNGADIADQSMMWGDDAKQVSANFAWSQYTQFPDCGYDLQYTPMLETQSGMVNFPKPNSAEYEESNGFYFFTFQKCSQATMSLDPDCQGNPRAMAYNVRVVVTAVGNPVQTSNDDLTFIVTIGNTCLTDTLALTPPGTLNYILRNPPF